MSTQRKRPSAAVVLASMSLLLSLSGTAYAAGGGAVLLGAKNKAGKTTTISVKGTAPALALRSKGAAAFFGSGAGQPPFTVGSSTVVPGLNADQVDGQDASAFRRKTDPVDATTLDGLDSTSFLRSDSTSISANILDISPTGQTANSAQNLVMIGNFEIYDPSNLHADGGGANFTAQRDGMYVVSATVDWNANGTGYRRTTIIGPSGQVASVAGPALPAPGVTSQNVSGIERLAAGQSVHVEVLQGSGAPLGIRLARFQIVYVGP